MALPAPLLEQNDLSIQDQEANYVLAHFSLEEIEDLAELGPVEILPENETGGVKVWDLTGLDAIFKIPEIQEIIKEIIAEQEYEANYAQGGLVESIAPKLEELKSLGRGPDKELAVLTVDMLKLFKLVNGGKLNINPQTGLPEFFKVGKFIKKAVGVILPMVGAYFGGPLGAAVGGTLGAKIRGKSWKESLMRGGMSGLGAGMFSGLGGNFGALGSSGGAGTGGFLGGAGNMFSQIPGASFLSKLPGASFLGNMTSSLGGGISNFLGGMGGQGAASAIGQGATAAGSQAGGGLLSSLGGIAGKMAPIAGMGLMMNRGRRQEQRQQQQYDNQLRAEDRAERRRLGLDEPFQYQEYEAEYEPNRDEFDPEEFNRGNYPMFTRIRRAQGGIVGKGKGQDDLIRRNIPENSYIIDASTVSDIGDGSTQAGIKELDRFFGALSIKRQKHAKGGKVKALVSDGEYEVSPEHVYKLGNGSFEKGARKLDKMVKRIRADKRTSGSKLPPKSKAVGGYLKKLQHG